jgi:acyl-CoA synthetase (AMP-forming)/AMP-acid ligase II
MNLAHNLDSSAQFFPRHPTVREVDKETTSGELNEMANRIASALVRIGSAPDDLVALCPPIQWNGSPFILESSKPARWQ